MVSNSKDKARGRLAKMLKGPGTIRVAGVINSMVKPFGIRMLKGNGTVQIPKRKIRPHGELTMVKAKDLTSNGILEEIKGGLNNPLYAYKHKDKTSAFGNITL